MVVIFEAFLGLKPRFFVHSDRETAQKRLRNGQRNGQVSAKPATTASPRGDKRSWGVTFPSDQASWRASPARAREPRGPFHQPGSFRGLSAFISAEGSLNIRGHRLAVGACLWGVRGGTFAHERTHEAEGTLPPSQACGRARRTSIHANTRRHEGVLAVTKAPESTDRPYFDTTLM